MRSKTRITINSQTPFIRFKLGYFELVEKYGKLSDPMNLDDLHRGVDYELSPGGVTSMIYPLLNELIKENKIEIPYWISLGPNAPYNVKTGNLNLINISLNEKDLPLYTNFKEGLWRELHLQGPMDIDPDEYEAFTKYNWYCAKKLFQVLPQTDLYFIHDFQQIQIGNLIGPSAPTIFRWHIPFKLDNISPLIRNFILKNVSCFDAVIVSTRRDLEDLVRAGYHGKAFQLYPYTDINKWKKPSRGKTDAFISRLKIKKSDKVITIVARIDAIKSQDLAIAALSQIRHKFPSAKLLLLGNGSFTGSRKGGLAHPKSKQWKDKLLSYAKELKVEKQVIMPGYIKDEDLATAYSISDVIVVPSRIEGFNLTTIEAWIHRKPVIVSTGAGSSELVVEDINGYVFDPNNHSELGEKIELLLKHPEAAIKMGEQGYLTALQSDINRAVKTVTAIFDEMLQAR